MTWMVSVGVGNRIVLLNSGQTGVERGAFLAARAVGLDVSGFMTTGGRDELGPIPGELARALTPCRERGPARAQRANIETASVLVVAVPSSTHASRFTGIKHVMHCARKNTIPMLVCDPESNLELIARQILTTGTGLEDPARDDGSTLRLYVTGPRATRWTAGIGLGRRLVLATAIEADVTKGRPIAMPAAQPTFALPSDPRIEPPTNAITTASDT